MFLIQHLCELIFLTEDFHWFKNVVMNTVCEKDMNIGCFLFLAKVCVEGGGGGRGVMYHQQTLFEIITFKVF